MYFYSHKPFGFLTLNLEFHFISLMLSRRPPPLPKSANSFRLTEQRSYCLHLNNFLNYECESHLKQPLTSPSLKIIVAYCTLNLRFAIEVSRQSIIQSLQITHCATFALTNVVENEAHIVLECPLYNYITNRFPSMFDKVVLDTLKSFFQLDHQTHISLYLTKTTTLSYCRE